MLVRLLLNPAVADLASIRVNCTTPAYLASPRISAKIPVLRMVLVAKFVVVCRDRLDHEFAFLVIV